MTTTKQALLDLALRVEGLSEGCRKTDADIATLLRFAPNGVGTVWLASLKANSPEVGRVECRTSLGTGGPHFAAPKFTDSLDAAVKLVPDDYDWILMRANGGLTIHAEVGSREQVFGNSPALALTASALRARAAMMESE